MVYQLEFSEKMSTIAHTLNVALQMEWKDITIFGFMDAESWYAGDKISQAIEVFQNHPSVTCVVSDYDNHHPDGRVERIFLSSFDIQRLLSNPMYDRNFLVRSQVFPKMESGFNEQMPTREEYDLFLRISEIGLIYHIPAPLHNNTVKEEDETTKQLTLQAETFAKQLATQRRGGTGG